MSDPQIYNDNKKRKALDNILEKVSKRIAKYPDCGKLLAGIDFNQILEKNVSIDDNRPSGNAFSSDFEAAAAQSDKGPKGERLAGGKINFNEDSYFFTDELSVGKDRFPAKDFFENEKVRTNNGFGKLSYSEIKELIIIHELVHLADKAGLYDDMGKINKTLNSQIVKDCFPGK